MEEKQANDFPETSKPLLLPTKIDTDATYSVQNSFREV